MPTLAIVRGAVAMNSGQRTTIDPTTGKLIGWTSAIAWLDAYTMLGVQASLTLQDVLFTANDDGTDGNGIRVRYVLPGVDGAIAITVSGNDITVTLARTGGVSVSTGVAVAAAVNANADAGALVTAASMSATVQTAVAFTSLSGGVNKAVPRERDEIAAPDGQVWMVVSAGLANGLFQCSLVGKVV